MTKPKKPEPNPIEEAIGSRAKTTKDIPPIVASKQFQRLAQTQEEPSPSEMLSLEELNRQTEERLQDEPEMIKLKQATLLRKETLNPDPEPTTPYPTPKPTLQTPEKTIRDVLAETIPTPVSRRDHLPVTKTSSPESPPQMTDNHGEHVEQFNKTARKLGMPQIVPAKEPSTMAESLGRKMDEVSNASAEEKELTALKKYILEDGFVMATVAFHIVSLCAQPMTTPSTTSWDFVDRAFIPDMVLALLNQPGYLAGIWPSLRIVMGSNKGNQAWCAGIATTIAFFDVIRTLPAVKELKK